MTDHYLGRIPVTTDPDEHARLLAEWDRVLDTEGFQDVVAAAGHQPPDHRPGWLAVPDHGADGDVALVWVAPESRTAEPIPGYATLPDGSYIHMRDLPGA